MAYGWAHLVFVERWRLRAVRGLFLGMWRIGDRTYFQLHLQSGDAPAHAIPPVELYLLDAGDFVKEKRLSLFDRASVIVHPVAASIAKTDAREPLFGTRPLPPIGRKVLDPGSLIVGEVLDGDGERNLLIQIGFPVVVGLRDPAVFSSLQVGDWVTFTAESPVQGFILVK